MQGGGDTRVRPTALEVFDEDGNAIYDGVFQSELSFSGQGFANALLMNIHFSLADITGEELTDLGANMEYTNCRLDETAIDEDAYIGIYTTEATGRYTASYSGDEHIAPFRVDVVFE